MSRRERDAKTPTEMSNNKNNKHNRSKQPAAAAAPQSNAGAPVDPANPESWKYAPLRTAPAMASNDLFMRFYRDVNPLFGETASAAAAEGFADFIKRLESPLQTTFWINDTDPLAETFKRDVRAVGGKYVAPLEWYPQRDGAWRVLADKETFRKAPDAQPLRQLMIRLTALGVISRQEEVSMIPPLLLQIGKNDRVLDCCAAPGSKTAQCLVALGRDAMNKGASGDVLPFDYSGSRGFVVANELDEKRSNMLVHQCKRMRLLYPFAVFTNHDARYFPTPVLPAAAPAEEDGGAASASTSAVSAAGPGDFFDKVLCDVMCSGDGTLRKAPGLLRAWKPFECANLQRSQIQVALRGIHLLKVGGRLVYSTCSMHPIENEAVVSQILLRTNGAVRLVDPRAILPNVKCDPGLKTWQVMLNDGSIAAGPDATTLHPALFPVPGADYPLERCMRLLPHHMDGGGFFVALFEKVQPWSITPLPSNSAAAPAAAATADKKADGDDASAAPASDAAGDKKKKDDGSSIQQALLPFASAPRDVVERDVIAMFNVDTGVFPIANLLYRTNMNQHNAAAAAAAAVASKKEVVAANAEKKAKDDADASEDGAAAAAAAGGAEELSKRQQYKLSNTGPIQLAATGVRDLLLHPLRNTALRVSAAGLRAFVPQAGMGSWRISNEASPIVAVAMTSKNGGGGNPRLIAGVTVKDVLPMINGGPLKDLAFDQIENEELRKHVVALDVGCVLLLVRSNLSVVVGGADGATTTNEYVVVCPALRARSRLQLLVDQEDLEGLLCRLGVPPQPKKQGGGRGGEDGAAAAVADAGDDE